MLKNRIILITFILLFSFSLIFSDTIIVDTTGGGDYTTIQEGIDAATDGDTVLVYTGIYYENINYNGKDITVASKYITTGDNSYIDSTIIDGNQSGSVVTFNHGENPTAILCGFTIQNGTGTPFAHSSLGGGLYCYGVSVHILNCTIKNNIAGQGGGICCRSSNIYLSGLIIKDNHVQHNGGGIHFWNNASANFDSENRCSIFLNYASTGCELRANNCNTIDIVVDTFTVMEPKDYFVYPLDNFTFDILNCKVDPVNQDLYVSPDGNDNNSGITPDEPLKTISFALTKIASDSTHLNTIHLANGTYSPSLTDEIFPLNCRSCVSIIGQNEQLTILDGDNSYSIMKCLFGDSHFSIENLTIQNGNSRIGGGMYIYNNSNPIIKNVTIKDNFATLIGTHIFCIDNCNPIFENVKIISLPIPVEAAGISLYDNCSPVFINCSIEDNNDIIHGTGAIYCNGNSNPILINTKIINNKALGASGITVYNGSEDEGPILINCTICNNLHCEDGTIRQSFNTNLTLINCILRNYPQDEIYFDGQGGPDTVTISYTNIDGGIGAINTNNNGTVNWGEGNMDSIPQFVGGDPFSYELTEGSPCIDAGTPDTTGLNLPPTDLAGYPRIYNGRIDIGAYEYQGNAVEEPDTSFINKLYLFQNKPNPFSSSTTITFISADYERIKDYKLSIYNAKGQLIRIYNGKKNNFWVKTDIVWDGTDEDGNKVSPGVYFYKLSYGKNSVVSKMIFMR